MFVCMSVGVWRANGNPNPFTHLDKILQLCKEGFSAVLTPAPSFPAGPGEPETLKDRFLKTVCKTKDVHQVAN